MKTLNTYINEKLVLNKDTFKRVYNYFPKDKIELCQLLRKLIDERKNNNIIDLNDIDTSNITDMSSLFELEEIKKIDISGWNVSNAEDMSYMFYKCENLKSVGDLTGWDVSNVTNMSDMFMGCKKIKIVEGIEKWNMSNVINIKSMFAECENFIQDLNSWKINEDIKCGFCFYKTKLQKNENLPDWFKNLIAKIKGK